jgi:hypothetical protein
LAEIKISSAGNEFVAGFSLAKYEAFIVEWKELLLGYIKGKR